MRHLVLANAANAKKRSLLPKWKCRVCGVEKPATLHQLRQRLCSARCVSLEYKKRMQGKNNPNYSGAGNRSCRHCNRNYRSYNKNSKFCSFRCYVTAEEYVRGRARKDSNHALIVETIKKLGGAVLDLSQLGRGVPDLAVLTRAGIQLVEIKSPNCQYGKDLSESQKKWADDWRGTPVYIVRTLDDAINLISGKFSELKGRGGSQ